MTGLEAVRQVGADTFDGGETGPSPELVARLQAELVILRERLETADWALRHLGPANEPLESRLLELVKRAAGEAQRIRHQAREHAEKLVVEAEQLRALARQGANEAAASARYQVGQKARSILDDADRLRLIAEQQSEGISRAARAEHEAARLVSDDITRTADRLYQEAASKSAEAEELLVQARAQADQIGRTARSLAEQRVQELTAFAQRNLTVAGEEAEKIIARAEESASRILERTTLIEQAAVARTHEGGGAGEG